MGKLLLYGYLVLSLLISLLATTIVTANMACNGFDKILQEGDTYSGICGRDGTSFVGTFVFALIAVAVYLLITKFVLQLIGYKLTKTDSDK